MSQPASEFTTLPRSVSSTELHSPKCFGELSTAFTKHLGLLDAFSGVKHISKWEVATPDIRSKSRYKVSTSYSDVLASHNQHFSPQKGSPSRRSPTHENLSPGSLKAKYSVLPSILPEPKDVGTPGFFDRCLGAGSRHCAAGAMREHVRPRACNAECVRTREAEYDRTGLSVQELLDFFNVDAAISDSTPDPLGRLVPRPPASRLHAAL